MIESVKVLIVERRDSQQSIARQLLANYDLEFNWRHVDCESALQGVAAEFNPGIVFCADEMPPDSRGAALDVLRLLSLRTTNVLLVEMGDGGAHSVPHLPEPESGIATGACGLKGRPAVHWRNALPSILQSDRDAVVLCDAAGWITYANAEACRTLAASGGELLGTILGTACDFSSPEDRPHRLAFFHAFTALPTPVHASDLAARIMQRAQPGHRALPVVALNLQGLRLMNESCGSELGDKLLEVLGSRLRAGGAGCGIIAPVGADDVLVVLPAPSPPAQAVTAVRVRRPAAAPADPATLFGPLRSSDNRSMALAVAASAPQEPVPAEKPRSPVEAGLDEALRRHTIGVHYQPQFELYSGRGCGVEALCRWFLTSGESIAPAVFIPVAERAGLVGALGAYVLKAACHTAAAWRGRDAQRLTLSVNISTLQINEEFSKVMAEILKSSGFPAHRLELEIAESALLADIESTNRCLSQWKQLGLRIAVSHAGDNYSRLGYLSKLPVDRLKLDRSLIHSMTADPKVAAMVSALIALGSSLGIHVIAEGVETQAQFQMLTQFGCLQAQGFLLGRPMPAAQALVVLRKPWGNLPRAVPRPATATQRHAS